MVSLSRLLIPPLITILIDLVLRLFNTQYPFLSSSPMMMVLPAIEALAAVYLYFRLSGTQNITGKESVAFGLLTTTIRNLVWGAFTTFWRNTVQTILYNLAIQFAAYSAGALFCAYILPQIGLAPGTVPVSSQHDTAVPRRHRRLAFAIIAIVLVIGVIVFPTSHIRTYNNSLPSFTFGSKQNNQPPANLTGGQTSRNSISLPTPPTFIYMNLSFTVDIRSTENVTIAVTFQDRNITQGQVSPVPSPVRVLYNVTDKVQKSTFQLPMAKKFAVFTINLTAMNPSPKFLANGTIFPPARISGSVNLKADYQLEEWTQWWKP